MVILFIATRYFLYSSFERFRETKTRYSDDGKLSRLQIDGQNGKQNNSENYCRTSETDFEEIFLGGKF